MYIRFVVGTESEDHRSLMGIITEAQLLINRGALEVYEINQLEEILEEIFDWLNE
jgi:hypothetical protein